MPRVSDASSVGIRAVSTAVTNMDTSRRVSTAGARPLASSEVAPAKIGNNSGVTGEAIACAKDIPEDAVQRQRERFLEELKQEERLREQCLEEQRLREQRIKEQLQNINSL